jgi:hypothetical protein
MAIPLAHLLRYFPERQHGTRDAHKNKSMDQISQQLLSIKMHPQKVLQLMNAQSDLFRR